MKTLFASTVLLATAISSAAFAGDRCNVPAAEWQPQTALETKLKAEGWEVRSIKTEDGCYEAYAIDAKGNKVEAYFDPKTFTRVGKDGDQEG
ncbi:hypothetical protein FHS85_002737 [Rhodoligotrophos appendicifer]|uniref:PepSY domain-containing protein n=1 Tax=Rhodoligotrophos appendicifer TaxID=987056 RepID=UPI001186DD90|nr:PepSY domain-containing protein [Rhodoligotrophos appendicifer]